MLLENLMEDKQLNFNQPLLSVRRMSPTVPSGRDETKKTDYSLPIQTRLPRYTSELKSGPVRNPGVVPFIWEQSPGRPKDESRPQIHVYEKPPIAPRLPPGRRKVKRNQDPNKAPEGQNVSKSQTGNVQNAMPSRMKLDEKVNRNESFDSSIEMIQDKEKSESDDTDEAYVDALATLSRTESFFMNCSISGLSEADAKPSGTSLTDAQTRDFMMERFLPAAKAMASETTLETPYYAPRKQPAIQEQPRQVKKILNGDKRPQLRYGPSFALHYSRSHDNEEEEEESDDDCYDDGNLSSKVCGLLPRFCLKSSFCLLNPVPGMSMRTRVPASPASRARTGSSQSTSSCNRTENERSLSDVSEQRSVIGSLTAHTHEDKNDSQGRGISTCANDPSQNNENKAFLGSPEENSQVAISLGLAKDTSESFQELLPYQNYMREVDFGTSVAEKTLYVDTVHKPGSPIMKSFSPAIEGLSTSHDKGHGFLKEIIEQNPLVDSSLSSSEKPVEDRASLKPNLQKEVDFNPPSTEKLNSGGEMMALMVSGQAREGYQDVSLMKPDNDVQESTRKLLIRREKLENSCIVHSKFPVAPPLPKSPSDSWLGRTLPSLSTKNASSRSYPTGINPKNQAFKTLSGDPKWETIVKTTRGRQQHSLYSEELMALTPIPEAK